MSRIRVKRTFLVEETLEYNSDTALSVVKETMESGVLFDRDALLIGSEIRSIEEGLHLVEYARKEVKFTQERISDPQIISIETV